MNPSKAIADQGHLYSAQCIIKSEYIDDPNS
jgi:hypothetical protein